MGSYDLALGASTFASVERLALYTGLSAPGGTANHYAIATHDATVAAGGALFVTAFSLAAGETLVFNGTAETNGRFDVLGGGGADILAGGAGNDYLAGNAGADQLYGMGGNDVLVGGAGADQLRGGAGSDLFRYEAVGDSTAAAQDRILDFGPGDRIDLSAIDARPGGGDDAFAFIGAAAFSHSAGELRAVQEDGGWRVEADTNGDGVADLSILVGTAAGQTLGADAFML